VKYSTVQVARLLQIGRQTLHRWIKHQPSLAPRKSTVGGVVIRLWTDRDVEKVRKYKDENYRKREGSRSKRKR
jgi:DNA-binding transcriptional MerR regulator